MMQLWVSRRGGAGGLCGTGGEPLAVQVQFRPKRQIHLADAQLIAGHVATLHGQYSLLARAKGGRAGGWGAVVPLHAIIPGACSQANRRRSVDRLPYIHFEILALKRKQVQN